MPRTYPSPTDRLLANSCIDPETLCWHWRGRVNNQGRPKLSVRSSDGVRTLYATQFILHFIHGIKRKAIGRHSCHNKACVNPDHIRPGTTRQNNRETIANGRHISGWRYWNEERRQRRHLKSINQ